ncbi:hypothetical protein [Microbacterium allomyrinae]|uniref:Uncharacterized protein n=1 Tax=Microbacterium allomyrinae TaxID=2830666 RepID=A0A9X1S2U9_9MICO|nr:hypothetical protein [Microbacterium allomyrinae]MCC2033056.1 hypothetical protein [Microbacterium allomyrinae]
MKTLAAWFTDGRRQALQAALATLLPVVAYFGWVTTSQADALLSVSQVALQLVQGVIGLALLRPSAAARWLTTVGRGILYALAGVVGPLGVAFRWWGDDTAAAVLTITGLALTAFAAFVQVVNVQTIDPQFTPGVSLRSDLAGE